MNFSIGGGGVGLLGGIILFGALMIVFTIVMTLIVRAVRGRDDREAPPAPTPEDDYVL